MKNKLIVIGWIFLIVGWIVFFEKHYAVASGIFFLSILIFLYGKSKNYE
jgi:hypothetical protein